MRQYRTTKATKSVEKTIANAEKALSHQDILEKLKGLYNRVTIYRVLEKLVEQGIIHKTMGVDGVSRFASCNMCTDQHQHEHIHFNCCECKEVTCIENITPTFQLPHNYLVKEVQFSLSGICPKCYKKE